MSITIKCRGCDVEFEAQRINKIWCDGCKRARRKAYQQNYDHTKKGPCPQCGKPIGHRAALCRVCDNKDRATRYLGENNPNWRKGRTRDKFGYVLVRVKPQAHKAGAGAYRREHHVVWEQANGKPLPNGWVVHHLNGIKDDNRPENLLGISRKAHHTQHRAYERRIRELEKEIHNLRQLKLA